MGTQGLAWDTMSQKGSQIQDPGGLTHTSWSCTDLQPPTSMELTVKIYHFQTTVSRLMEGTESKWDCDVEMASSTENAFGVINMQFHDSQSKKRDGSQYAGAGCTFFLSQESNVFIKLVIKLKPALNTRNFDPLLPWEAFSCTSWDELLGGGPGWWFQTGGSWHRKDSHV